MSSSEAAGVSLPSQYRLEGGWHDLKLVRCSPEAEAPAFQKLLLREGLKGIAVLPEFEMLAGLMVAAPVEITGYLYGVKCQGWFMQLGWHQLADGEWDGVDMLAHNPLKPPPERWLEDYRLRELSTAIPSFGTLAFHTHPYASLVYLAEREGGSELIKEYLPRAARGEFDFLIECQPWKAFPTWLHAVASFEMDAFSQIFPTCVAGRSIDEALSFYRALERGIRGLGRGEAMESFVELVRSGLGAGKDGTADKITVKQLLAAERGINHCERNRLSSIDLNPALGKNQLLLLSPAGAAGRLSGVEMLGFTAKGRGAQRAAQSIPVTQDARLSQSAQRDYEKAVGLSAAVTQKLEEACVNMTGRNLTRVEYPLLNSLPPQQFACLTAAQRAFLEQSRTLWHDERDAGSSNVLPPLAGSSEADDATVTTVSNISKYMRYNRLM